MFSLAEVKVVFIDGAARQTDSFLIVIVTLKPAQTMCVIQSKNKCTCTLL